MTIVQTMEMFFGKRGLMYRFHTFTVPQKALTIFSLGGGILTGIVEVVCYMNEAESRVKLMDRYRREFQEKRARRKMIGNDVAHGLAWSHYCGFLRYVLPAFEEKVKANDWYIKLDADDKERMHMKLYEVIPRKCYITPEQDDNMEVEATIVIEHEHKISKAKENINIKIYSIKDKATNKKYYCLLDCPSVLKTFNTVIDVQVAGISRSKVQLLNFDAKLVQLMRFYYSLSCFNKIDKFGEKARLVLFNESDKKLSDALLEAIQTDLGKGSYKQDQDTAQWKKTHRSLMEKKLLSAEELKDVCYDYDCYVTQTNGKIDDDLKTKKETISTELEKKSMKMLLEKDCFGKDWLERLKYASTKCRWIVFLDGKESTSDNFVDYNVVSSLKDILKSRKVQTVAIVDEMRKPHIHDHLRWVTCIPNGDKDDYLSTTLYKVMSGSEVNLEDKTDLCMKQGDAAVGLAWGYAVDYLNLAISGVGNEIDRVKESLDGQLTLKKKLYIVVPTDCNARPSFEGLEDGVLLNSAATDSMKLYKINNSKYFAGQYASPVNIICQMNQSKLVDEKQMQLEAKKFYMTLQDIMRLLLPDKEDLYEFIYFDGDQKKTLKEVMSNRVK